eukprot:Sspe_Gene.7069::Locus_2383_Transcript_1_1_Confidence_1.000_Length_3074::g.7069::m.7069
MGQECALATRNGVVLCELRGDPLTVYFDREEGEVSVGMEGGLDVLHRIRVLRQEDQKPAPSGTAEVGTVVQTLPFLQCLAHHSGFDPSASHLLLLSPVGQQGPPHALQVLVGDGLYHVPRSGLELSHSPHNMGKAGCPAAEHSLQQVPSQTGPSSVNQHEVLVESVKKCRRRVEDLSGDFQGERRVGPAGLETTVHPPHLILPSSSTGEELFESEHRVHKGVLPVIPPHRNPEGVQEHPTQNGAPPQPRPHGEPRGCAQLKPSTKSLQLLLQWGAEGVDDIKCYKGCLQQCCGCLRLVVVPEGQQRRAHRLTPLGPETEVEGLSTSYICLEWLLTPHSDSRVDHHPPAFVADGRCVCPPTGEVDAGWGGGHDPHPKGGCAAPSALHEAGCCVDTLGGDQCRSPLVVPCGAYQPLWGFHPPFPLGSQRTDPRSLPSLPQMHVPCRQGIEGRKPKWIPRRARTQPTPAARESGQELRSGKEAPHSLGERDTPCNAVKQAKHLPCANNPTHGKPMERCGHIRPVPEPPLH